LESKAESLHQTQGGSVGALGRALCCALAFDEFGAAVLAAINHDGDADTTGALCGTLAGIGAAPVDDSLGAPYAIDLVETVAADLHLELTQPPSVGGVGFEGVPQWWWLRYPGW
jgi:hypothetical protein